MSTEATSLGALWSKPGSADFHCCLIANKLPSFHLTAHACLSIKENKKKIFLGNYCIRTKTPLKREFFNTASNKEILDHNPKKY